MLFGRSILRSLRIGFKGLMMHKLRSALTVLGVVFGVGSVIVMLAIGEGIRYEAVRKINELGATNIIVRSVKPAGGTQSAEGGGAMRYGLTLHDVKRLEVLPSVASISPMRDHQREVRNRERKVDGRVVGVTPEFLALHGLTVQQGRFICPLDCERASPVAVLGAKASQTLFPLENPLGKTIRVGPDQYYYVLGVTRPRASSAGHGAGLPAQDYNRDVYIPFPTDQKRFGETVAFDFTQSSPPEKLEIRQMTIGVADEHLVKKTAEIVESTLRQHHQQGDTVMTVPLDLLEKAEQTQRMFTLVLGAIASISLLVGGIGIMNIMLATVTERTREIGLRRALGARRRDIVSQFLVESVALTSIGGLVGVGLGIVLALIVAQLTDVATLIRIWGPLLALVISIAVGLIFGIYPARRAASMRPIEALRHE